MCRRKYLFKITGAGTGPGALALGEIDGDGKLDLACVSESTNAVYIRRNNSISSSIRVAAKVTLGVITSPQYLEICDLDGDGLPEVLVMNLSSIAAYASSLKKARLTNFRLPF